MGAREARRLVEDFGVQGFKYHPTMQAFFPNDRLAYPPYEASAETVKTARLCSRIHIAEPTRPYSS